MTTFKLPEPIGAAVHRGELLEYTEAQLKQVLKDVLEQAAQVCESLTTDCGDSNITRHECAMEIRKMIGEI